MTITPQFIASLSTSLQYRAAREYERKIKTLWWRLVAGVIQGKSKRERVAWALEQANIESDPSGGEVSFDELVLMSAEFEHEFVGAGLLIKRSDLADLDAGGLQGAASWSRSIGARAATWPQRLLAAAILRNPVGYDGKEFFAVDHPINPYDALEGVFANLFTGAASGEYPGALPIGSGTLDDARANVAKACRYISEIAMPRGAGRVRTEDADHDAETTIVGTPRGLRVSGLLVPPALLSRAQQIGNVRELFGVDEVGRRTLRAVEANAGMGEVWCAPELGAKYGGSDTSWYALVEGAGDDDLGAFTFSERQPVTVTMHDGSSDVALRRSGNVQMIASGRNTLGPSHPYLLFRADAA